MDSSFHVGEVVDRATRDFATSSQQAFVGGETREERPSLRPLVQNTRRSLTY